MWPDSLSDARSADTGPAPRRNTEGGIQPADKSLINRRLKRSISCSVQRLLSNKIEASIVSEIASKWSVLLDHHFIS